MLSETEPSIRERAERLRELLKQSCHSADIDLRPCQSQVGGGSLPLERLESCGVSIWPWAMSTQALERRMLDMPVPIVPRVADDHILLDMRTADNEDLPVIAEMLGEVLG